MDCFSFFTLLQIQHLFSTLKDSRLGQKHCQWPWNVQGGILIDRNAIGKNAAQAVVAILLVPATFLKSTL